MTDTLECCGIGATAKLAIGKTGSTLTRMDFIDFQPQIVKVLSDGSKKAIRGSLDHQQATVAEGLLHVRFRTRFWVTSAKMDILLLSLGFTEGTTDVFTIQDVIPDSTVVLAPGGGKEWTMTGCIPSDWKIEGQKGQDPVLIDIGWVGKTLAEANSGTYSFGSMVEGYPYPFAVTTASGMAATLTLGSPYSMSLAMPQVRISVDNHLAVEFNNSITATNICPSDREVVVSTSALYSTCDGTTSLFSTPLSGDVAGCTFDWSLQRLAAAANNLTDISIANVKPMARLPRIVKNDFNRLPLHFAGFATNSLASLIITNKNAEA